MKSITRNMPALIVGVIIGIAAAIAVPALRDDPRPSPAAIDRAYRQCLVEQFGRDPDVTRQAPDVDDPDVAPERERALCRAAARGEDTARVQVAIQRAYQACIRGLGRDLDAASGDLFAGEAPSAAERATCRREARELAGP